MPKLFVLGDSFSYPFETKDKLWPIVAGEQLSNSLKKTTMVVNYSLIGASQDYTWKQLDRVLEEITSEDFLVIVLTSNTRFWYFDDRPEHSNIQCIENVQQAAPDDPAMQNVLMGFSTRIWRDSLATQLEKHRLGYLCYQVIKKKLKTPIILKGFAHTAFNQEEFPELSFSNHCLSKVQLEEFEKFDGKFSGGDILMDPKYWHHIDCRYNHLCLSNHLVLGEILADSILNDKPVDLTSNRFQKALITETNCKDKDFAAKEFYLKYFNEMINNSLRQKLGAKSFKLFF